MYATWLDYNVVTYIGSKKEVLRLTGSNKGSWRLSSPSKEDPIRPMGVGGDGTFGRNFAGYTLGARPVLYEIRIIMNGLL